MILKYTMGRTGGRQKRERSSFEIQLKKDILSKKRNDGTPYSEKSVDTFVNNIVKISPHFLGKAEIMVNLKWLEDAKVKFAKEEINNNIKVAKEIREIN